MRPRVAKLGVVEWAFIGAVLVLIVAEWAAFQRGLGPYGAVIALGYVLALVTAYLLYRHDKALARKTSENITMLRGVDIFSQLTDQEIEAVASLGRRTRASSGEVLGRTGETGSYLYIVIDGTVQLSAASPIGEITVRIVGPGESFPLATLIDSGTLITSATSMTHTEMLAIPRSELLALWQENPKVGMRMSAAIAGVLASRYKSTLGHLTSRAEQALKEVDFWANV